MLQNITHKLVRIAIDKCQIVIQQIPQAIFHTVKNFPLMSTLRQQS